jgi:membrane protein implicated in regulation of membrane protease activity
MGILLGLFLVIFWGGVIMLVLSITHVFLVSPWFVLIGWLVLMGVYITGFIWLYKKYDELEKHVKMNQRLEDIEEVAALKVYQMQKERAEAKAKRRAEMAAKSKSTV